MKIRYLSLLALALATPAYAGDSTVTTAAGTGGTTFHIKTDGSANGFGFTSIGDGVAGAYSLTIKNASTAPVAGDFAAVVALSPNSLGGAAASGIFVNPATGATFPVSGTIAATQSGTWNITNISGTVSLPTGAATAALQPTNAAQGSTTSGQTGHLIEGAVTTASPTYTTAQTSPLSLDTSGNLRVNVVAGGGTGGTSSSINAAYPATGTAAGAEYLSSPPTLTSGQMVALQTTSGGSLHTTVDNTNANGAAAASASAPVTPSNQPIGAANFAATQVSCAATATSVVAARTGVSGTGRIAETITNTTTTAIYVGASGVTTATGQFLPGIVGASLTVNTTAALYCIVASGTATVTSLETY